MPTQGKGPLGKAQASSMREGGGGSREGSSSFHHIRRSSSLKRLINRAVGTNRTVKTLFHHRSKKPRSPVQVVDQAYILLRYLHSSDPEAKGRRHQEKVNEIGILISEMKLILYGTSELDPLSESCSQLTREFFKDDAFRLLISCLPKLGLEARKDATQVVANLQRQPVNSQLIASKYLEENLDIINYLIIGYEDPSLALHYGGMLRECIRHQVVARYVLNSQQMKNFFEYIQFPNFDVAADAISTFKELMTRHKSTVAEFLSENYSWFFDEFNSKLLESTNYITKRQAVKLLSEILLDRSNAGTMVRYVSSKDNLRISMNLLRDSSKSIQIDTFHVFKLFVANKNKPNEICRILHINRGKLLLFFSNFKTEKEDEIFEADKAEVVRLIEELDPCTPTTSSGELFRFN